MATRAPWQGSFCLQSELWSCSMQSPGFLLQARARERHGSRQSKRWREHLLPTRSISPGPGLCRWLGLSVSPWCKGSAQARPFIGI